jgi:hypothetical protein
VLEFVIRPPDISDTGLIFNSWLKSYRNSDFAKHQCNAVYFGSYKLIVEKIISRSMIYVACDPKDYTHVYGYIVFEELPKNNLLLHYVYVKHTYRKMQVASKLLEHIKKSSNPVLVTHWSQACKKVDQTKFIYDPYKI